MTTTCVDISVVICAYTEGRWDDLVAAITSVQQQIFPAREIVLVIDHNPRLLEKASKYLSNVILVDNQGPAGANGSRNAGVAATKGNVLAFLDDDAVAVGGWLEQINAEFKNPQVLAVGGLIEPLWLENRPRWFPEEFFWVLGCSYRGMPQKATEVRNLIHCNMAVRREVWDTIGGLNDTFGHVGGQPRGCGDTEFGIRVHQHWPHHLLVYTPHAKVYHKVPASRSRWQYFCKRCKFEGHSKALLTRVVGTQIGLSSERTYTLQTLPRGILRGVVDGVFGGDLAGLLRAGAIMVGLAITTLGYLAEKLRLQTKYAHIARTLQKQCEHVLKTVEGRNVWEHVVKPIGGKNEENEFGG